MENVVREGASAEAEFLNTHKGKKKEGAMHP